WPPDVFAFTAAIIDRAEAYRFTVSPPSGQEWPPTRWREKVRKAARSWSRGAEASVKAPPRLVANEWQIVRDALETPVAEVASGRAWRLSQALLTLHALADEASAGVATGTNAPRGPIVLRARMSELLARTGSLARIDPAHLRVLPKYRTPYGGITSRS